MIVLSWILSHWYLFLIPLIGVTYKLWLRLLGAVIVPEDSIGILYKKFVLFGSNRNLPDGAIVALNGEAGIQADTLAPGLHFGYWPWQYDVDFQKFVAVPEGAVGVVESKDGKSLPSGRILARQVECDAFQNARKFLQTGGERGPQIAVITPGTYRINTALFKVQLTAAIDIQDNMVGIVTTSEGAPLKTGDIAGREIPDHRSYQDGQAFVTNGGSKGLQEQVMLAGRYYINPKFATVEIKEMTNVPIATVGVVIAFVGDEGSDVTGESFKHGNLVRKGQKGVWVDPLDPGKYPVNPYTHRVELVPTANVVLNWASGKTESHQLDKNLSTITVRSSDGYKFNLDVSQIIHIPRNEAPKVIARFGSMSSLVTQVLEPTIGNYFRNAAQSSDVIDFLRKRTDRQNDAKKSIGVALSEYNVGAVDTLIGDIVPPEELMKTLTDRKLAEQAKITYDTQRLAEETKKELEQAKAQAATQARVVDAERQVQIAEFQAQANVKKAQGDATAKTVNATADAEVLTLVGNAEATKTTAVGMAEAAVIDAKTKAIGKENYAVIEVGRKLAENNIKLVPDIVAGGSNGNSGTLVDVLLAGLISNQRTSVVVPPTITITNTKETKQ